MLVFVNHGDLYRTFMLQLLCNILPINLEDKHMANENIVIFSSGISEQSGITENIKNTLNQMGFHCIDWRGLFASANDTSNIALLPMLIKKIPTFDFAVLVCEGHDITYISRGKDSETAKTMRDNVLFEIGLCAMAIGLNRTILVTDSDVRLPDDLKGTKGQLAVKQITLSANSLAFDASVICEQIYQYIHQEKDYLNQVVIGAAASGACGYATNFICRTLEHIEDDILLFDGKLENTIRISPAQVHLHIILPNNLDKNVLHDIKLKQQSLLRGTIVTARNRPAEFHCYLKDEELHIVDYPTNVVTSYDTARMILEMDADDSYDERATERFVAKEMALYESTLKSLLKETFVHQVIEEHYPNSTDEEKNKMIKDVLDVVRNRLTICRY